MKKVSLYAGALILAGLFGSGFANAQSKLSHHARVLASESKNIVANADGNSSDALREVPRVKVLIGIAKGSTADQISVESLVINTALRTVATASIDADKLEELAASKAVTYVELAEEMQPDMIHVRHHGQTGITTAHRNIIGSTASGEDAGLGKPFLGNGVITALYDTGLDPNHLNFRTGDNYADTRVKALYVYTSYDGTVSEAHETPEAIKAFTTENSEQNHGTHVLGIMAGSYNGSGYYGEYVFYKDKATKTITDSICYKEADNNTYDQASLFRYKASKVPYYGVAPQSEIMIGCGPLYDDNMLDMAVKVRDRAKAEGKPAVFNLSCGGTTGPKDGSTLFNRALEELGEDIIISVASANDGNQYGWITKEFTETDKSFKTFVNSVYDGSKTIYGSLAYGAVELYGKDDKPFTVTVFRYNVNTGERVDLLTIDGPKERTIRIVPVNNFNTTNPSIEYIKSQEWEEGFEGYLTVNADVNPLNNRYSVCMNFSSTHKLRGSDSTHPVDNTDSHLAIGIEVKGDAGQKVWANASPSYNDFADYHYYNNGTEITYYYSSDFTDGTTDNSVNDMACGKNVFAVGSYINRTKYGVLNKLYGDRESGSTSGRTYSSLIPQDISASSGYASDLVDGRQLPHVAMPGANVVSSNNTYYMDKSITDYNDSSDASPLRQTAVAEDSEGTEYFWTIKSGTSMSSPCFAGSCALFLEADPTLKWDDINDVLKVTCRNDKYTEASPERFGYGKVDVYAAIKEIIRRSSVAPVYDVEDKLFVKIENGNINVLMGDTDEYTASVYNLNGIKVASESGVGEMNLPTSNLAKGVYIVNVNNAKINKSAKVVVK